MFFLQLNDLDRCMWFDTIPNTPFCPWLVQSAETLYRVRIRMQSTCFCYVWRLIKYLSRGHNTRHCAPSSCPSPQALSIEEVERNPHSGPPTSKQDKTKRHLRLPVKHIACHVAPLLALVFRCSSLGRTCVSILGFKRGGAVFILNFSPANMSELLTIFLKAYFNYAGLYAV